MANAAVIRVHGERELARNFGLMGNQVRGQLLGRAALAGGLVVEAEAKRRVRRKTSTLARSIHSEVTSRKATSATAIVGTDVDYGKYLEMGTGVFGPRGTEIVIRPKKTGGVLRFQVGGRIVFAREVRQKGIKPLPFMEPALEAKQNEAGRATSDAVWTQVRAIFK
jgi:hypothetical protein